MAQSPWVVYCTGEPLHTDGRGMEEGEALLPQPAKQPPNKRYANEVLYGIINAIVGAPTMISFAAIVYQVRLLTACLCHGSLCMDSYCSRPLRAGAAKWSLCSRWVLCTCSTCRQWCCRPENTAILCCK